MAKDKKSIKYEVDISGFKKNIKEAESNIASLNRVLKLNQTQLKGNQGNIDLLSARLQTLQSKYDEQIKIIENANKCYEEAKKTYGEASKEAKKWENELIKAQEKEIKIKNAIEETNKKIIIQSEKFTGAGESISRFGNKIENTGRKVEEFGNGLSIVSVGIGALAVGAVGASIKFESAWTGVTKTVDATEEQLKSLRTGILELSKNIPSTAIEISSVAENAGQLGIHTENILTFSKTMLNLADSTNMTAEESATQLARLANITQMSQDNFDRLGSTIVDLGNNLATTEAEITEMALRLAGAGNQIGLSEAQILAFAGALSSVGIEAEAGGSAFSKLMVDMQLAVETRNDSLKQFAKVAGMTTKEFSKAFKEDAAGAIIAFIEGLSKCESKGTTAIKVLDDMGISEIRLRDTLLRAAGASEVFSNSLRIGTNAWNENIALTNEVNKRYETTESKLKILKNELVANTIAFGDELKPSMIEVLEAANPLMKNITSCVNAFNNLSDTTKQNIIKMGAFAVAAGPTVKVGGKLVSTTGSLIKNYGNAIELVGEWSAKLKINTAQKILATTAEKSKSAAIKTSTSTLAANTIATNTQTIATTTATMATKALKVAMVGIPIIGVVAGIASAVSMFKEFSDETVQTTNKLKEQADAWNDLKASQTEEMNANMSQMENVQKLRNELSNLVDENGRVKQGYEGRVSFILNELNEGLGLECKLTDGVIEKYKELQDSIDETITKKKASLILETQEQSYKTAIDNKDTLIKSLRQEEEDLGMSIETAERVSDAIKSYLSTTAPTDDVLKILKENGLGDKNIFQLKKERDEINASINAIKDGKKTLQGYFEDISSYEENFAIVQEGNIDKINELNNSVMFGYKKRSNISVESLNEEIKNTQYQLDSLKEYYKENQNEITLQYITSAEERLNVLAQELLSQTTTTEELTPEITEAWRNLATTSYDTYAITLSQLPAEMQQKIQEATGVIVLGTPGAAEATRQLSEEVIKELDNSTDARAKAVEMLQGYLSGLSDEEQREFLKNAGIENVDQVMQGLKAGDVSEEQGTTILKGLLNGLNNQNWKYKLFSTASGIASKLAGMFNIKVSTSASSGLPGHKDGLDYVPYDNYIARLHKGERVLTAEENRMYNSQILEKDIQKNQQSLIVNFYPQSMTEAEMQKAERYISKKWGIQVHV